MIKLNNIQIKNQDSEILIALSAKAADMEI